MPKRTRSYRDWQREKLTDPEIAASYLRESLREGEDVFLSSLGKVAQAYQSTKVAKDAGIQRETLYRAFSEQGNPTLGTLSSVLKAVGLRISIEVDGEDMQPSKRLAPELVPTL
jgi:probable addiction module antidote protein